MPKRVLIIATDGFEQSELMEPRKRVDEAGFDTVVASIEDGEIRGWDGGVWGDSVEVDLRGDEVEVDE